MTIKKSCDQVGLIAIYVAGVFFPGVIAEHGLGNFRINLSGKSPPQHGRRDGLIEQAQPAAHLVERGPDFAFSLLQGNRFQPCRNRDFAADVVLQELFVEALHGGQNG